MSILRLIGITVTFGCCWFVFQLLTPTNAALSQTDRFSEKFILADGFPYLRRYHLFEPTDLRANERLPLIVVLHGASQRSSFSSVFANKTVQAGNRAFVIAPEVAFYRQWATPNAPGWPEDSSQELEYAIALTQQTLEERPIDPSRVYVVGASQGGSGVFGAFARHPGLFAAGISYAGGWDVRDPGRLQDANIWALHGMQDKTVPPQLSVDAVEGIRRLGGQARLTLLPDQNHGFQMTDEMRTAIKWMLSQKSR